MRWIVSILLISQVSSAGVRNPSAFIGQQLYGSTAGSILFSNGTALTQDNSNLYWNDTNFYLGISTASPDSPLTINTSGTTLPAVTTGTAPSIHIGAVTGTGTAIQMDAFANAPQIIMRRADTSAAAPSAIQSGDILGQTVFLGYGTSAYQTSGAAKIVATAAENWSGTTGAGYLGFYTRPTGTVGVSTERVRISQTGSVGIGTTSPLSQLDVAGGLAVGTYAGVTAAPSNSLIVSGNIGAGVTAPAQAIDAGTTGFVRSAGIVGASAQPTITYGTGAGTGAATVAIIGSQTAGYIQFTTGTGPVNGTVFTITASNSCPQYLFCSFQAANASAAARATSIITSSTANTCTLSTAGSASLVSSTAYAYNFFSICY